MINPHPFNFYSIACDVHPLAEVRPGLPFKGDQHTIRIFEDAAWVSGYFEANSFIKQYLPSSAEKLGRITAVLNEDFLNATPLPDTVNEYWAKRLREDVLEFESVLDDELRKLPIFCCDDDKIGNFSISKLLNGASGGYPNATKLHLSQQCLTEIDEAGRCLVYERSTAAAFHVLRSVELTIRQYLLAIPNFVMPPLNRQNWGQYLSLLKDNGAAKEVADHLYNIKDNYRNPLMHPEDSLEMEESVSLFAVCQSMNEMLIRDMYKRGFIVEAEL